MTRSSLYVISIKIKNYITKIDVFFRKCVKYSYNKNYHSNDAKESKQQDRFVSKVIAGKHSV